MAADLLVAGANPNAQDDSGGTALMMLAQRYSIDMAQLLLRSGASVNIANHSGHTVLIGALNRRRNLVAVLLSAGGTLMLKTVIGEHSVNNLASEADYPQIVKALLKAGADPIFVTKRVTQP